MHKSLHSGHYMVKAHEAGTRLDQWLAQASGLSRSAVKKRIQEGAICSNVSPIKANHLVVAGEWFELLTEQVSTQVISRAMPLDIRFEDSHVIVVNKPSNMLVHPVLPADDTSLVSGLLAHTALAESEDPMRPGIVHRLDKDTTGLVLAAKTTAAFLALKSAFMDHHVIREYLAIVHGVPVHQSGTIAKAIAKTTYNRLKRETVSVGGRRAVTHYRVLLHADRFALLHCRLDTGRTHQIRVHLQSIGLPVVGDPLYGQPKNVFGFRGQALHAHHLVFNHPISGDRIECWAPAPPVFQNAVRRLDMKTDKEG